MILNHLEMDKFHGVTSWSTAKPPLSSTAPSPIVLRLYFATNASEKESRIENKQPQMTKQNPQIENRIESRQIDKYYRKKQVTRWIYDLPARELKSELWSLILTKLKCEERIENCLSFGCGFLKMRVWKSMIPERRRIRRRWRWELYVCLN